jgi:ribosomal protein L40E
MTRCRTSIIWGLNKEEIQNLLDACSSFVEVLVNLGLDGHSGNHRTLQERIKKDKLNIEKLTAKRTEKRRSKNFEKAIPLEKILVENSTYSRRHLKNRLISEGLLDYKCDICKNNGIWNNKKLVLQLEHKNGKSNDNRLENLCFLCPNCHSQTDTYAGRNVGNKKLKECIGCGAKTAGKGKKCRKCAHNQEDKQKFHVSKEELQKLVSDLPILQIGKIFGVSDNAIRKRCKKFGIDFKKRKSG